MRFVLSFLALLLAAAIPPRTAAQTDQQIRTSPGLASSAFGFGNGATVPIYNGAGGYSNFYGEGAGNYYSDPYPSYGNYYPQSSYYAKQSSDSSHANCNHGSSIANAQQDVSAKAAYQQQWALQSADAQNQQFRASQHPLPVLPDLDDERRGRQFFQQPLPVTELTYSRKDMERVYGANFQPPIFTVAKRQPHAIQGFNTRYLAPQQQFQHPLPVLRSADLAAMRAGAKYEPASNLYVERPVNAAEYEFSAYRASEPNCREKRQVDSYQFEYPAEQSYDQTNYAEEARSALPPSLFRRRPLGLDPAYGYGRQLFPSPYAPHSRGAMDGIQQVIGGFTQFFPMLAGNGLNYAR
ncbi:Hypothetical protein NTJ_05900 [Nesidiocoris tenuis]|uniref:Uncharacterized protein n=1 Tax=Nesidiocoris tenuis TaxID=355587 RepID=A0ABN7AQB5_9HEMI|nr:Hypothetical protein NTJ_05900 [Nesidiocoris tenuis]